MDTRSGFWAALEQGGVDLVISDYLLPQFDGLAALKLVRTRWPDLPFILVSGTLGEEQAVESLKGGATDYVLKDRLLRLVPACSAPSKKPPGRPAAGARRRNCAGKRPCWKPR